MTRDEGEDKRRVITVLGLQVSAVTCTYVCMKIILNIFVLHAFDLRKPEYAVVHLLYVLCMLPGFNGMLTAMADSVR